MLKDTEQIEIKMFVSRELITDNDREVVEILLGSQAYVAAQKLIDNE